MYRACSRKSPKSSGFTIVELLVVIVVIGILAAITIVAYTGISQKAVSSALQSDLANASTQLKMYQVDNGAFPVGLDCSATPAANTICLKSSSGNTYTYYQVNNSANPQTFSLHAGKSNIYYHIADNSSPTVITSVVATGGTLTIDGAYRVQTFTSSGTLTVTISGDAEVLVIGGGGGGSVGGGGAGGYLTGTETLTGSMTVTVGGGGAGRFAETAKGDTGSDSSFGSRTAKGGGGGGRNSDPLGAGSGSSGGGGGTSSGLASPGGLATPSGQGNSGGGNGGFLTSPWSSGGGGGIGTVGRNALSNSVAGNGGAGLNSDIVLRGTNVGYAGGGAGAVYYAGTGGSASHGGGAGGQSNVAGVSGTTNTGGGGGGGGGNSSGGGNGGSGIVIIRYLAPS